MDNHYLRTTLAYLQKGCETHIIADGSPKGLGAILVQRQDDLWRVISYVSRNLTSVKRRYSQTEKEALALIWACKRFKLYIYGHPFDLETDHKALEHIYGRRSKPLARIESWVLRLQGFDYKVVYRPGKASIADALSRLNSIIQPDKSGQQVDFVCEIAKQATPVALSPLK